VVAFGVPADTVKSKFWPVEIQPGFLSYSTQPELGPVSHVPQTKHSKVLAMLIGGTPFVKD
jgi:hypothetical protein